MSYWICERKTEAGREKQRSGSWCIVTAIYTVPPMCGWCVTGPTGDLPTCCFRSGAPHKDSFPGCYDISSAGHIPAGQDFRESALRELREELGVKAEPGELHEVFTHKGYVKDVFYGKPFINYEYSRVYLMEYTGRTGDLKLQKEEVESVLWMDYRACLDGIRNATLKNCIFEDEFEKLTAAIEDYFRETGRPLACAEKTETWAEDAQNDLQDWIEEQGIYLRQ